MYPTGLRVAEERDLVRTLRDHHKVRVKLSILDLDGKHLSTITNRLVEGQVSVDATADITRSLAVTLDDPHGKLPFDSDSPDDGALYSDRMLRVHYAIRGDTTGWWEVPVFTGPVTKMDRQADAVSVEASGKEILAMGDCWDQITFKKNTRKSDVIHDLLARRAGERHFAIHDTRARLDEAMSLGRETIPWLAASRLAAGMGRQLFYDGEGVCRLRRAPDQPVIRFRDGSGGTVQTPPQVTYATNDLRNVVWVVGGVPKDAKKAVHAVAMPQRSHPLSPWRQGRTLRDGTVVPRHLVEKIEDDTIRSKTEAKHVAEKRLAELLRQVTDVTFDAWPTNPLIEERDVAHLSVGHASDHFTLRSFNIPLVVSDQQSIGYVDRTRLRRHMRRHRR